MEWSWRGFALARERVHLHGAGKVHYSHAVTAGAGDT